MLKGENQKDQLETYEIDDCRFKVEEYIKNENPNENLILNDRLKINECFYHFKNLYNNLLKKNGNNNNSSV